MYAVPRRRPSTDPDFLARELVRRGLASPAALGPVRHIHQNVLPTEGNNA